MPAHTSPSTALHAWKTILSEHVELGAEVPGRDLWHVTAGDGRHYVLKRLGPWRNLPLADEARILRHLSNQGIGVAEFIPTDRAFLFAGEVEESFVLMPRLDNDHFTARELLGVGQYIGAALAKLHLALATYPWPANSYVEALHESLSQELMLPPDVAEDFAQRRAHMIATLSDLPVQRIHGDLTPENVLIKRPGVVSGFIDFDHLPIGPRIWDIGKLLSRRIRLGWRQERHSSSLGRLDHLPGLLAGYHWAHPLTSAEIEALPSAIAAGNVLEISYFMEISAGSLPRRKLPDHDDVLADTIEAARWHLANWEQVANTVRSSPVRGAKSP